MATDAQNACYCAKAKDLPPRPRAYKGLTADQQARLTQAQTDDTNGNCKAAYDTLSALVAELQAAKMTYSVVKGDSLWRIAGKSDVYGNPYQWPLIYKANADKIKHADLIYPKQDLDVKQEPGPVRCGRRCELRQASRCLARPQGRQEGPEVRCWR